MKTKHYNTAFDIKALDDTTGTFSGYGSVFDVIDSYREIVVPGAFKKSLAAWRDKKQMPALLWQHDPWQPIGVYKEMKEDKTGLYVEGHLALDTVRGKEALSLLKMGAISGLSIGFSTVEDEIDRGKGIRLLKEIDLWEVSLVTFPANEEAQVETVKEKLLKGELPTEREFEQLLTRDAGLSRSEALIVINQGFKALQAKRDAGAEGLQQLAASIERATRALTS